MQNNPVSGWFSMSDRDLKSLQILMITARPHVAMVLRQVLNIAGVIDIHTVADARAAIALLCTRYFDAVFCDDASSRDSGEDFGRAARKSPGLLDPMVPVFLVCGGPRRRDVESARDLGYTNVVSRPISAATILRKLRLALERPRPFIVAPEFFGPDRRAQTRAGFRGKERRKRQPRKVKIAGRAAAAEADLTPV
jgi:two-component system chemotaxis response regulator CheY